MAITISGTTGIAGVDGSAGTPAVQGTDTNTGVFYPAADTVGVSTGGSERLRVDSSGNVGIGTSSPAFKLEIVGATNNGIHIKDAASATVYGGLFTQAASLALYARSNHALNFGTNDTERMRIDSSGNLLVGTTSTTSNARLAVTTSSTSNLDYGIYAKNSGGAFLLGIDNNGGFSTGTAAGSPYNATTATAANTVVDSAGALKRSTSSLKYKTDVHDATHGLAELLKLRPVTYKGKNDGDTIFGGLIAEEVEATGLTEFVQYADDGTPDALAYGNMVSLCIKAIQEQQALITALTDRITALEAK